MENRHKWQKHSYYVSVKKRKYTVPNESREQ